MSKKKDKIRIGFIGKNADDVTGSQIIIEVSGRKILLECGLYQCNNIKEQYKTNSRRLEFRPSEIDYIFLNHLHIDHCGMIPKLYANGCKAKIISPKGTRDLFKVLCRDSAFILSKDVELLCKKYNMKAETIYTEADVEEASKYFCEYDFGEKIELDNSISFRFVPSGHIINAAQLELWLTNLNHTSKILYTSDLGNISVQKYYVTKFEPVDHANVVIGETTYGDSNRSFSAKDRVKDLEKMKSVVESTCIDGHGKVLIPVFSMDRTQNILTYLYDLFGNDDSFDVPILIDSPLSIQITNLYGDLLKGEDLEKLEEVLKWKNIKFVREYEESKGYQKRDEPMVILAASGFMTAGRSKQWAKVLLPSAKNHILFVGYSSPDSLAGKIKNRSGQKTISIDGKPVPNRCGIVNLLSFSSHIQFNDMLKYYSDINSEKICLVHGEMKGKTKFGEELRNELSRKNKSSKAIIVNKGTELLL